ncbi:hypothetical protein [Prauserella cavernicola]|uniref:PPE domain-containing protein n=1 Tax=Prauserella cavernicola TaxID=2800127 RepID=A0A934QNB1_9PSEU|nr:hypothetical protein [Prauserella cavernicola]MBK1783345.1 hypothetical protein [Prauserella cavernicola]
MSKSAESAAAVSDPASEDYDPNSPHYDVTIDSSSPFYVGAIDEDDARSGDDIRAEIVQEVEDDPLANALSDKEKDKEIQSRYADAIADNQQGLDEGLELRQAGERPSTVWDNATHEQMVEVLSSDADSSAIAETSEEWVQLGNDLTLHQRAVAEAIDDSMGNWTGEGGNAAREHLAGVAKWLGSTAQGAVLTGRQQQIHSQTLNESQKQMAANPPVEFSVQEANASLMQMTNPVQYAMAATVAMRTMQEQKAAREQAARIMTQFDDTVGTAVDMPLFSPPPKLASATATPQLQGTPMGGGAGGQGDVQQPTPFNVASRPGADGATDQLGGPDGMGGPGGLGEDGQFNQFGEGGEFGGGGPGGQGLPPGVDAQGNPLNMPEMPGADGQGLPPGSIPPGGMPPGGMPPGGMPPGGIPGGGLPGGGNFTDQTHQSSTPTMPTPPPLKVPDGPGGYNPGGFNPGNPGNIGNNPGNMPNFPGSTTPTGYKPPDPSKFDPGKFDPGKTPGYNKPSTIGWNGGVNGDGISNRLGGLDGGGGKGSGALPKFGGGGGVGAAGVGGLGAGLGGGGAAGGGAGAGGPQTPGQVSGAAKGLAGGGAAGAGPAGAGAGAAGAGARGMAGGMGMGGMGGGGAGRQKEEDKEHRVAAYLESEENIFAGENAIAPPVIGDWKANKDNSWQ